MRRGKNCCVFIIRSEFKESFLKLGRNSQKKLSNILKFFGWGVESTTISCAKISCHYWKKVESLWVCLTKKSSTNIVEGARNTVVKKGALDFKSLKLKQFVYDRLKLFVSSNDHNFWEIKVLKILNKFFWSIIAKRGQILLNLFIFQNKLYFLWAFQIWENFSDWFPLLPGKKHFWRILFLKCKNT